MCATVSWGAHESFMHPIFILKNGCDMLQASLLVSLGGCLLLEGLEACVLRRSMHGDCAVL
jgi:hypothetical protein